MSVIMDLKMLPMPSTLRGHKPKHIDSEPITKTIFKQLTDS
jgi:hypothetical protein